MENDINLNSLVNELSIKLADSFSDFVQILGKISETTEKYYETSHSRFVADKVAMIAEQMNMNDEDIMEIKIAGLLHDIGKLIFPDTLLFKFPSEMTQQEYLNYSKHPEFAYYLLKESKLFDNISEIILQHHEKLDGSGFPRHLTAEKIHIGAKMIAVVDYYHNQLYKTKRLRTDLNNSITNLNSYLSSSNDRFAATMNYLHRKKNILFDAKIVDIFTDIIEIERKMIGEKTIVRVAVNAVEPGMVFAEDYYTSYGMLIAAKGEVITNESKKALLRCVEYGEVPNKILVIK